MKRGNGMEALQNDEKSDGIRDQFLQLSQEIEGGDPPEHAYTEEAQRRIEKIKDNGNYLGARTYKIRVPDNESDCSNLENTTWEMLERSLNRLTAWRNNSVTGELANKNDLEDIKKRSHQQLTYFDETVAKYGIPLGISIIGQASNVPTSYEGGNPQLAKDRAESMKQNLVNRYSFLKDIISTQSHVYNAGNPADYQGLEIQVHWGIQFTETNRIHYTYIGGDQVEVLDERERQEKYKRSDGLIFYKHPKSGYYYILKKGKKYFYRNENGRPDKEKQMKELDDKGVVSEGG